MNRLIQQMVNQKINTIKPEELITHAKTHNIDLKKEEAIKIISIFKKEGKIDIYNKTQHKSIIRKIAKEVNPNLAKKANELLTYYSSKL